MYVGHGFRTSEIGDVDIVRVDGVYHLFHLVLPNHDYIAHAVSDDGFAWRRVENALFIGDPGAWDDDMLWTMHVSPDPHRGGWRMFYTGLAMRERGRMQRIGLARSDDLYHWTKVEAPWLPLEADPEHYEASLDEGRNWVSFRDPCLFEVDGRCHLTAAARVPDGPIIRRGCAALLRERPGGGFEALPPLHHPRRYDDLEVPTPVQLDGRWYLIASIREDVKVHYWLADEPFGEYRNFSDNVLLPQGNYAARVSPDGDRPLVWNFYVRQEEGGRAHLLPPPKELCTDPDGRLHLKSFRGFDDRVVERLEGDELGQLEPLLGSDGGDAQVSASACSIVHRSGFEAYLFPERYSHVRLSGTLRADSFGKLGLALRIDDDPDRLGDGYYLSIDLPKGIAQMRAWAHRDGSDPESAFDYRPLQIAHAVPREGPHPFAMIAYGSYLELSFHGRVLLSLADDTFREGRFGFYVESAAIGVEDLALEIFDCHEDDPYVEDIVGGPQPRRERRGEGDERPRR